MAPLSLCACRDPDVEGNGRLNFIIYLSLLILKRFDFNNNIAFGLLYRGYSNAWKSYTRTMT